MTMDGTILVTGGTGTVGRELVRRLAAEPTGQRIAVLSRAAGRATGRLEPDVAFVQGDLRAGPGLGLSADIRADLAAEVTEVIHCAAETRFSLPIEEVRAVNVAGTRDLLEFAADCRRLRKVGCFSTVYVAGRRTGRFTEDDLADDGAGFANTYELSKSEMEREVRGRMADLPVAIYRLSTVIGDSVTGAVTGWNAFHHALRLLYHGLAPMVPGNPATPVDLVSVNYVADASHWLFRQRFEAGRTYHLCSGPERSGTLAELIDAVIDAFRLVRPGWRRRAIERPAVVDAATYELFVRSVEETGNEVLIGAARVVQSFATQLAFPKQFDDAHAAALLEGSGYRPVPTIEFLPKVVRTCVETEWGARAG
ncbi:MAG TPA: SDR family oxidoreductase [Gemmatimonadota bacterium]|nr:SDR family oxidoreductase [Gemmatimonadota bacterium]